MTCIVGLVHKGRVWMGGDSAGVDEAGLSLVQRVDKKVFVNGPFLFGFTSSFRMGQLLAYAFKPPLCGDGEDVMDFMVRDFINGVRDCLNSGGFSKIEDNVETGGGFLVGYDGRLFHVEDDYQVGESLHGYDACGCGEGPALGSLFSSQKEQDPRKRIHMALSAAETFSGGVRAPFHVIGQ